MVLTYTAAEGDAGRTVYSVMRRELCVSASLLRRLKRADAISVDGQSAYTNHILAAGETVTLNLLLGEPPCDLVPEQGELEILFENEGLLAVNKPAGMLVHPSRARYTGTLANYVAGYLAKTRGDGRCHAVGRLDRDTTGVVLFAKNGHMKALAGLSLQQLGAVKEYTALVFGAPDPAQGVIDRPIRRAAEGDMLRIIAPDGQRAVTRYETAALPGGISRLRLTLETGRTHQIRVHCLSMGCPILGDGLYGTPASRAASQRLGIRTQALHARRLAFTDPLSGGAVDIIAPGPEIMGVGIL